MVVVVVVVVLDGGLELEEGGAGVGVGAGDAAGVNDPNDVELEEVEPRQPWQSSPSYCP